MYFSCGPARYYRRCLAFFVSLPIFAPKIANERGHVKNEKWREKDLNEETEELVVMIGPWHSGQVPHPSRAQWRRKNPSHRLPATTWLLYQMAGDNPPTIFGYKNTFAYQG